MVEYALKIKFVPQNQNIYVLHPGYRKRQFEIFHSKSSVFLELPGFIPDVNTYKNEKEIIRRLKISKAVRDYVSSDGSQNPSRSTSDYSDASDDSLTSQIYNFTTLFNDAKKGDLILCPGSGPFSRVLVGELTKDSDPADMMVADYFAPEKVPFRPVKWVNNNLKRVEFGELFARSLGNRRAIISLTDPLLKFEIYKKVYGNFVSNDNAKITIYGKDYDSKNPSGIIDAITVVRYLAAGYYAHSLGQLADFSALDIDEAIEKYASNPEIMDFAIQFTSPGKITFIAFAHLMAMFVALGVGVLTDNVSIPEIQNGISVISPPPNGGGALANTGADFNVDLGNSATEIFKSMNPKNLNKIKKKAENSRSAIGLKTDVERIP